VQYAGAACTTEVPGSVLRCYHEAYQDRDLEALRELLAPDFISVNLTDPQIAALDREETLALTEQLFSSSSLVDLSLRFGADYVLRPGSESGTWEIRGVVMILDIGGHFPGHPGVSATHVVHNGTLYVRLEAEPEPHCVIYREELADASH
ncbi:MAG: nuclear transport factor 2 family protein, partial [Candidatus Eisenbacteria sp.]|nr:nuclear transport factor 2 family protein [Candidatus Eisenbacteria bacterium]